MTENKQEICNLLLKTLQATRHFSDLVKLSYSKNEIGGREYVVAFFANGAKKATYVTADSGAAMIRDILKRIT